MNQQAHPPGVPELTTAGFKQWLESHGLGHLIEAIEAADAQDVWAQDGPNSSFLRDVEGLYAELAALPAAPAEGSSPPEGSLPDLTYILAYLRSSRAMQFLAAFDNRFPGTADELLPSLPEPTPLSPEAALVARRLMWLIQQQCYHQIFAPARRAEVMAALAAASSTGED